MRKVVFIGFMGSGKTSAARRAAAQLGIEPFDSDDEVERRLGKPIAQAFAEDGEAAFREAEETAVLAVLERPGDATVSLGGGAVASARVRQALGRQIVIWLDADVDTAWSRANGTGRPLAADRFRFGQLHREREPLYAALATATVPATGSFDIAAVLDAVERSPAGTTLLWAVSASGDYPAYVGPRLLGEPRMLDLPGRRFLVTDGQVGRLYADSLEALAGRIAIMPGEQSKTVAHAEIVWTELVRAGMTRTDIVLALGGGVVGDLAGFCAATFQRGVRYVQMPTTLVAQVDSAYGGKTGVDLAEAKNYVGAYHQPSAVIADTDTLATLPPEEVAAGFAEVVKTALIAGGPLWEQVRAGADPTTPGIIAACARTKLGIVARDERDTGPRQMLNLGHTVGHAIETVTGYARYRHGEAVGLGLLAALRLSEQADLRAEVQELLTAHGLPTRLDPEIDPDAIVVAAARDKKRVGEGPVPFVLIDGPGAARTGCFIDGRTLTAAVRELAA